MFLNKKTPRSVVTRLSLGYAFICLLFCTAVFAVVSIRIKIAADRRIDKTLAAELREFSDIYEKQGRQGLHEEFKREAESNGAKALFCLLVSPDNHIAVSSDLSVWKNLKNELLRIAEPEPGRMAFETLYPQDEDMNTRAAAVRTSDGSLLIFGINLQSETHSYEKIQRILIAGSLAALLLSTLSVWLIARHAMSGVRRVTRAVADIRKESLNRQVPQGNEGREINELADAFNQMLRRISTLVRELKEISDNVAHDLRSPITRMRGAAETTLTGPQELDAYREMGLTIIEESDRLTGMINTMLEIAQSESGVLEISRGPVDLTALLKNAVELFQPVAEEKRIHLSAELPETPLTVSGDKNRLQRVAANLLDNAIKYTPSGGTVRLSCRAVPDGAEVEIRDTGIGIAPEELPQIFDRFYRSEKSRSSCGNGLGLSLAQSIIQLHGGWIAAESRPGEGSAFNLFLPRSGR